ncbi:MAG: hypothetical protein KBC17_00660 [Candidatus Pacebacteria bacterium]|nr:hypothetical protein [Candidatus Paceibacterota bacterium]
MINRNFKVIPAIDVYKNGELVRLVQGDFSNVQTRYAFTLEEKVLANLREGALSIHTIDLAGAENGVPANVGLFTALGKAIRMYEKDSGSKIVWQVGGGIRTKEDVARVISLYDADLLILGAAAIDKEAESGFLSELIEEFGADRFVIDIAVGYSTANPTKKVLKKNGWKDDVILPFDDALVLLKKIGITRTLVTAKELDGMGKGPGYELALQVKEQGFEVILSGGVATVEDCVKAYECGLDGVVVGKAMLDGKVTYTEIQNAINQEINK